MRTKKKKKEGKAKGEKEKAIPVTGPWRRPIVL
jgi:hypothetical protein